MMSETCGSYHGMSLLSAVSFNFLYRHWTYTSSEDCLFKRSLFVGYSVSIQCLLYGRSIGIF